MNTKLKLITKALNKVRDMKPTYNNVTIIVKSNVEEKEYKFFGMGFERDITIHYNKLSQIIDSIKTNSLMSGYTLKVKKS